MEIKTIKEIKEYGVDWGLLNYNPNKKFVAVDELNALLKRLVAMGHDPIPLAIIKMELGEQ